MSVDRKFEVLRPTLDRLCRAPLEVANKALLNPSSTSPLALVDGELVSLDSTGKWIRTTSATIPAFFNIEDRGDTGVQASGKLAAIVGGGSFWANTVIYDDTTLVVGSPLMWGTVTVESLARSGVLLRTGSNLILGYVLKLPANNGGKLQFINTLT